MWNSEPNTARGCEDRSGVRGGNGNERVGGKPESPHAFSLIAGILNVLSSTVVCFYPHGREPSHWLFWTQTLSDSKFHRASL